MGYVHGVKWDEDLIISEIEKVKNTLNLSRMPSRSEIISVVGNGLACKISRTGGHYYWADKLNLEIKDSETKLGKKYEYYINDLLTNNDFEVEKMPQNHPYDLLINGYIKVDVKVSNLYRGNSGEFHTFNLEKYNHNCDIFICLCITDDKIVKTLIIPSKFLMKISQLSVGIHSIYDEFIDRFDYIEKYNMFYQSLK